MASGRRSGELNSKQHRSVIPLLFMALVWDTATDHWPRVLQRPPPAALHVSDRCADKFARRHQLGQRLSVALCRSLSLSLSLSRKSPSRMTCGRVFRPSPEKWPLLCFAPSHHGRHQCLLRGLLATLLPISSCRVVSRFSWKALRSAALRGSRGAVVRYGDVFGGLEKRRNSGRRDAVDVPFSPGRAAHRPSQEARGAGGARGGQTSENEAVFCYPKPVCEEGSATPQGPPTRRGRAKPTA
eukprot:scaffold7359_cov255-Pinguiococcus_pyrenoidosus.AAC.22